MGKLLLVAAGIALGAAVAVVLSAREQLDAPSMSAPEPQPGSPDTAPPGPAAVATSI